MAQSIAEQGEPELGGAVSILVLQRRDHHDLQEIMREYETAIDTVARARAVDRFTDRVLRHAFAEEAVLFPAVRVLLPQQGEALTGHIEGEHQQINELLQRLRSMSPDEPDYDAAVRRAITLVRDDARNEEDRLLPALQAAVGPVVLRGVGAAWEAMRWTAPNLPHPRVPRRPWGNVLAGVPLAVTDRVERAGLRAVGVAAAVPLLTAGVIRRLTGRLR